jgi:hypothetical protein
MEPPGPISRRELITVNAVKVEGNKAYCGYRSCNHFTFSKDPDTVLADAHVLGFILEPIDANTTSVIQISDVDINGSVPGFVKNAIAHKRAEVLINL